MIHAPGALLVLYGGARHGRRAHRWMYTGRPNEQRVIKCYARSKSRGAALLATRPGEAILYQFGYKKTKIN
eukprot:scaffold36120_cov169-Isochrysis_galbana.AAC.6